MKNLKKRGFLRLLGDILLSLSRQRVCKSTQWPLRKHGRHKRETPRLL